MNTVTLFDTKEVDVLLRISETHRTSDSLQYGMAKMDILFSYAKKKTETKPDNGRSISSKNFYSFHFMVRDNFNPILRMKEVTSQLMVDMYAKIETERLGSIRRNKKIKSR